MTTFCNGLVKNVLGTKIFAIALVMMFSVSAQSTMIVGNDAIERASSDGWSNFVIGMTSEVFIEDAIVTNWDVYANNEGSLGMLLLRAIGGGDYRVIGADFEDASEGHNSFVFNPDSGGAFVRAGDIIGLFIGTAKVAFQFGGTDTVGWCAGGACSNPIEGSVVSFSGTGNRIYSANVTAVSAPGTALILSLGLFAMALRRTKRAI